MICFPLDITEYSAEALGAWCGTRTRGVFSADTHFTVTADSGMTLTISGGISWLKMEELWGVCAYETSALTLSIAQPDAVYPRIDAVCIRLDKVQNDAKVILKSGVPAPSPVIPSIVRDAEYDELYVATVYVAAGVTEISQTNITDQRLNEDLCGVMRDGVTGLPTAQLHDKASILLDMIEAELARLNAGSEVMLKTEYAPDATATLTGNTLAVTSTYTHPGTSYDVCFTAPADYSSSYTVTIDGVTMSGVYDSKNRVVSGVAWAAGVPVTLSRRGGTCFFKSSGGSYGILPSQTAITAASHSDYNIGVTLSNVGGSAFAGTIITYKLGTSMPEWPDDGVRIDVGSATSYMITGFTSEQTYTLRAFAYNTDGDIQTDINSAVATITTQDTTVIFSFVIHGDSYTFAQTADPLVAQEIDWGDGTRDNTYSHTYAAEDDYTIQVIGYRSGDFHFMTDSKLTQVLTPIPESKIYPGLPAVPSQIDPDSQTLMFFLFLGCVNLTTVPSNLLENCWNVVNFGAAFNYCLKLRTIPQGLFDACPNVTIFSTAFRDCSSLTGSAPELWLRTNPTPTGTECFYGCSGLSNYAAIPDEWK